MRIEKYGVVLERLTHKDIELVRQWRNHPKIQRNMHYREYISPEMQEQWFQKINNQYHYYFLIKYKEEKIGVIHYKHDPQNYLKVEGGIFVWSEAHINSRVTVAASIICTDIGFYIIGHEKADICVLKDNIKAIAYNKKLGYVLCPHQEEKTLQSYELYRQQYETKTQLIKNYLQQQNNSLGQITIVAWERTTDYAQSFIQLFQQNQTLAEQHFVLHIES